MAMLPWFMLHIGCPDGDAPWFMLHIGCPDGDAPMVYA